MSLLTEQQYESLHQLIYTKKPLRVIAEEAGVSQGTVVNFRRACATVDSMPTVLREKIRLLMLVKMPVRLIAAKLRLPAENIYSLRRLDRFRKTAKIKCNECGTLFFPPASEVATDTESHKGCSYQFSQAGFTELLKITKDLIELGNLRLIGHPLFDHLVLRAERAYRKLHGQEKKNQDGC